MMEITLCPHFKERSLCATCSEPIRWGRPLCAHGEIESRCCFCADRACADCDTWAKMGDLMPQADGRLICRTCQKAIDDAARSKAQVNLFVQQESLF